MLWLLITLNFSPLKLITNYEVHHSVFFKNISHNFFSIVTKLAREHLQPWFNEVDEVWKISAFYHKN